MSGSTDWRTPPGLFAFAQTLVGRAFELDAASTPENALCPRKLEDGLTDPWDAVAFCNPPYDRGSIGKWTRRAHGQVASGVCPLAVLLVLVDTSTKWFHRAVEQASGVVLLEGRVRYLHPDGTQAKTPSFGSGLVIYDPEIKPQGVACSTWR